MTSPSSALLILGLVGSAGWVAVVLLQGKGSVVPALAAYALTCGAVLILRARHQLRPMLRISRRGLAWGLAVGMVMTASTYAGYPVAAGIDAGVATGVSDLYAQLELGHPVMALPLVSIVVAGEELLWRGVLLEGLTPGPPYRQRWLASIAIASGVYATAQLGFGSVLLVAVAFGCGAVWSALRLHTGELVAPLLAHGIWSAFVLWLVPLVP